MSLKFYLTLCSVFSVTLLVAQQRPIQSLYMFDPLLINPAYAGANVQLSATCIYRNQWINLDGAPKTFTQTANSGFRNSRVGLGYILSDDQIGIHTDVGFYGVFSYKVPVWRKGAITFGLQGGFNNLRSNFDLLTIKNPNDPYLAGVSNTFSPNVGSGFYYRQEKFYVGFSVPYLLDNKVIGLDISTSSTNTQRRYYYIHSGFTRQVSKNLKIVPSTLIRLQEHAPISFDANVFVVFYDAVGLGCSYRSGDSVIAMFELQLNDNFHVGYAYDMTTSALNQYSNGSHEIMINYRVKIPRIHKGVECPAYW